MIKISDIRNDNQKQLKDIELGGFFFHDDILYRRVTTGGGVEIRTLTTNGANANDIPVVVQATGDLVCKDRLTWVEPVSEKQIYLEISD